MLNDTSEAADQLRKQMKDIFLRQISINKAALATGKTETTAGEMESKTDKNSDLSEGPPVLWQSLTTIDDNESAARGEVRPSTARFVNNYGFEYQNWADKNEQSTAQPPAQPKQLALQPA